MESHSLEASREIDGKHPRVLISVWPGLGDIMFATPAIRHIRQAMPDAFIAAASLAGGLGVALLETNPYLDEVYFSDHGTYSATGLTESLSWARARRFDSGLELSHPVQWFFELAGIRKRYRFARRGLWWLVPYRDRSGIELHASEHFIRAAESAFGPMERDGGGYDLILTEQDEMEATALLAGAGERSFVAIHPGARCNENKRWDIEKFIELSRRLTSEDGMGIVVVGGKDDETLGNRIADEVGHGAVSLAGSASLRETAAIVESAALYVGNDSGPLHIAASTGTPMVAIFASSDPANFGPIGVPCRVVRPDDACAPCLHFPGYNWLYWGLRLRYYKRCEAMERIGVEPVLKACRQLLHQP
jgi:ADP-heptose:LPS heptosyltransferase